jgi:exopolyphosphatase/guanosine-5'-triphosphate,3'-diphosphate pyrophosphatase
VNLFSFRDRSGGGSLADRLVRPDFKKQPVAIVDIGSNSVRLVCYAAAERSPTPIFNEKVLCGLGREIAASGRMGEAAIDRAVSALTRFRAIARTLQVRYLKAVATAAAREAEDGPEFIARAKAALGADIEILSGEREAELAAHGVLMGFAEPDGVAGDLGGGSLELISIESGRLTTATSLPLGVLRLEEASGGRTRKAIETADKALGALAWIKKSKPERFFAVGGSWRSLAKLHMAQTDYPLHVMHHYTIETQAALQFLSSVIDAPDVMEIPGISAVSKARRTSLQYGAIALERTLRRLKPKQVVFSVFGIREGLIYEVLTDAEKASDPLITFSCEYAELRSRGGQAHGFELFDWMTPVFEVYAPDETPSQKRLRLAACLLSDIGWRAHPDYRGEQSLNVVAHATLTAINHAERLFLALTSYYRHKGPSTTAESLSAQLTAMAGPEQLERARLVANAVRAAHVLSFGMPGIIGETPLTVRDGKLLLELSPSYRSLDGERVRRRCTTLANAIGLEFDVVFAR